MEYERNIIIKNHFNIHFPTSISEIIIEFENDQQKKSYTFGTHDKCVTCIAVLPNERVASGSTDGTLKIWNLKTGKLDIIFKHGKHFVSSVMALPDGSIVYGLSNGLLRVCNSKTLNEDISFTAVLAEHLLYDSLNGLIRFCNLNNTYGIFPKRYIQFNKNEDGIYYLDGHSKEIRCIVKLPDGRIATGSDDNTIRIWNLELKKCDTILKGEENYWDGVNWNHITCIDVIPEKQNFRLVSGSSDGKIKIWELLNPKNDIIIQTACSDLNCVGVLSDGKIISQTQKNVFKIWNSQSGNCDYCFTISNHDEASSHIIKFIVLPKNQILGGTHHGLLKLIGLEKDYSVKDVNISGNRLDSPFDYIECIAQYSNNRTITGLYNGLLKIWY
jgi:WD40 repeat protein